MPSDDQKLLKSAGCTRIGPTDRNPETYYRHNGDLFLVDDEGELWKVEETSAEFIVQVLITNYSKEREEA